MLLELVHLVGIIIFSGGTLGDDPLAMTGGLSEGLGDNRSGLGELRAEISILLLREVMLEI